MDVPAGAIFTARQTVNDYDSMHETRWGGDCPGANVVSCTDDSDTDEHSWTNDQGSTERVYFIVDGYSSLAALSRSAWGGCGICRIM